MFDEEGLSLGITTYTLNSESNTIESRDAEDVDVLSAVYRYDDGGDLNSISFLSFDEILGPVGSEIQSIDLERQAGELQAIDVDYLIGNESDFRIALSYDASGRILSEQISYQGVTEPVVTTYNYDANGMLMSLVGGDIELPGVTVTRTLSRDSQGRVSVVDITYMPQNSLITDEREIYTYDTNGNISEIGFQDSNGAITEREVFSYAATTEPVFDLTNYILYYAQ